MATTFTAKLVRVEKCVAMCCSVLQCTVRILVLFLLYEALPVECEWRARLAADVSATCSMFVVSLCVCMCFCVCVCEKEREGGRERARA